jgi:predicted DNA binding CopG/RHH family protein
VRSGHGKGDGSLSINIDISNDDYEKLIAEASNKGISVKELIKKILKNEFNNS